MSRKVQIKPGHASACPSCGNETLFTAHSQQVAEDLCEISLECRCGVTPPGEYAMEDVWGGTSDENVVGAISGWNEWVADKAKAAR